MVLMNRWICINGIFLEDICQINVNNNLWLLYSSFHLIREPYCTIFLLVSVTGLQLQAASI
uniref:Uncharacterized protein n=1 Tax=Arundo donax TaxID=35708 RepID=A0A0A8YG72_ARUDO